MGEQKFSHKFRFSKSSRNSKTSGTGSNNIKEAIAQLKGGETVENKRQVKIMVKKEDLQKVLEAISRDGRNSSSVPFEERLNSLRKRQILRNQVKIRTSDSWMPVLQSIPEEV